MKKLAFLLFLMVGSPAEAACYVAAGAGQSTITYSGIDRLEERIFASGYANGSYHEDKSSVAGEVQLGCELSRAYGLRVEAGVVEGFRHKVHTKGTVMFSGFEEDFTVDRIVRARGYMLSLLWGKTFADTVEFYTRLGAVYATATADVHPMGSEYSVHAEKEGVIPVVGLGASVRVYNRWSVAAEYRVVGHPDVRQWLIMLRTPF